jgi:anti-sigma factor RsiW
MIHSYLDGELGVESRAAVEEHLATCRDCSQAYTSLFQQSAALRAANLSYKAPARLRRSVRPAREVPWRWMTIAASVLLVASVSWNVRTLRQPGASVAENVLSDHIRGLIGTHLLDVPSTDRHTVKPWFNGKLDFAPDVRDFADQGFPLIGGRLEYLTGRTVAAMVYHRRLHVITLFTWPESAPDSDSHQSHNGFQMVHWTVGEMTYWSVGDIPIAELEQFRDLYRK